MKESGPAMRGGMKTNTHGQITVSLRPEGSGGGLRPMAAGSKAVNRATEGKRLSHNAKVYWRTANKAIENYRKKFDSQLEEQIEKMRRIDESDNEHAGKLYDRLQRELKYTPESERKAVKKKYTDFIIKIHRKYGSKYDEERNKLSDMEEPLREYQRKKKTSSTTRTRAPIIILAPRNSRPLLRHSTRTTPSWPAKRTQLRNIEGMYSNPRFPLGKRQMLKIQNRILGGYFNPRFPRGKQPRKP